MGANDEALDDLAGAILDGTAIDWTSAQSGEPVIEQPLLDRLRVLAAIADFHRELLDSPSVPFNAADVPAESTRWGHLRLLDRIGHGAFGEVYRAWDTRLDREVALKLLPADASFVSRHGSSIIEEGRLLARVRHPNVVTIYGAERIDDRIGLWMEFVKGRTLEQVVEREGTLPPAKVVAIGIELSRAVAAVHDAGLLHRDIKTRNVMLGDEGRVVLMDFGTGREQGDRSASLAGTPLYLAPELLTGTEASVSSDIYSVGVLLYRLLTGAYPVTADDLTDLHRAHQQHERMDVRVAGPGIPAKLARIVQRALDPRPDHRHGDAAALATDLARLEPRSRTTALSYALGFAALIALAVWAGIGMRNGGAGIGNIVTKADAAGPPAWRGLAVSERPIVAVLPFKNLSAEADSGYFVDGLTDELIRNLALIDGMDVRSRTSSFFFKDKPRNLQDVVAQLGANLVVEGSVLRSGSKLRVNAQLVAVANDTTLWSQRFDRESKDVFVIQDEISRAIVNQLRLTLGRGQRRYNTNASTYELYLKARGLMDRRGGEIGQSGELFRQVTVADPLFAPAYAGLASAYAFRSMSPYGPGVSLEAAQSIMRPAVAKALELDPLLGEAHAAAGVVHACDREWTKAEQSFRRALELNPGLTQSYTSYAFWTLEPLGKFDAAVRVLETARRFDPLSLDVRRELGRVYFQAGQFDRAVAEFQYVKSNDPTLPFIDNLVGRSLIFVGRLPEAIAVLEEEGASGHQYVALAYVLAGRRLAAQRLAALEDREYPIRQARIYTALGDKDRAFDALRRMMVAEPFRVAMLLGYPEMAGLRGDPRLAELRLELNLPADPPDQHHHP